jgi:predicted RNA-binding Zn ribbon-like protein
MTLTVISHDFSSKDIIAGDPALDFVNTVTARDREPIDWIDGYPRLLEWAALAELLPQNILRSLADKARKDPTGAAAALKRAKQLREALFAMLSGIIAGTAPKKESLALLREQWLAGTAAHELRFTDGRVALELRKDALDFDLIASIVAYRIVHHVLTAPLDRLRICHGTSCAWLFIDSSKAGRRRWCDMAVCGNTAKSRRFQERARE